MAVRPKALFEELRPFLESTFPKSIRMDFKVAPDTPAISGDPAQLHQLLLSISVNARDAMPAGGKLSISAKRAAISPSAPRPHPDAVPGDFARIDIADTGSGIPDALKGQIFDPFFTTKGVVGAAAGLRPVDRPARSPRRTGGYITFVSAEGAGTTFSIVLPTVDSGLAQPVPGTVSRAAVPIRRGAGEHILIVDDEESVRLIMCSSLESFGFRVSTASGGAEAVALVKGSHERFDLALIDMQMPGLDGSKTILALRHLQPDLPIIGASGFATTQNREEVAANGIRHFLDKPFSVETLIRTVHAAMAKAVA